MVTIEDIKKNRQVQVYVTRANEQLGVIGWTEHGIRHSSRVAKTARMILEELGESVQEAELA
ncbi:MAG: phosphohydrolase, partial [bacterium]